MSAERWLKTLLRLEGGVTCLALVAVVMPRAWMAACHAWLGLGAFPEAPIAEYLARSLSGFYAFFGGLCLVASSDVRRHAPTVTYLGVAQIVLALVLLVVDVAAGLPWYWAAADAPPPALFGAGILALQAGMRVKSQLR
ncbi:MAG: hypothetical protein AMJ81_14620 [Phycisphaerae bacterium SM23_33]|nr:MAG: hypothetical protein AMJ81_14620 [Phycisphaerae bacterium SM23_33]